VKNLAYQLTEIWKNNPDLTILHLLRNHLPDQDLTIDDLLKGSLSYSHALAKAGVSPGEVVILILQQGEELLYAFWGAILHGAVPSIMPFLTEKLSPENYRRSLLSLFEITAPTAVITYPEFVPEAALAVESSPSTKYLLVTDEVRPAEAFNLEALTGLSSDPDSIVLLQHSSGTTGLQKGVALSHKAIIKQLENYCSVLHLNSQDVIVSWLPLYHDMGLIAGFILPILNAVPLVLLSPFDWVRAPHRMFQAVSKYKGTLTWLPNFAYNFCAKKIRSRDLENVDLTSWRAVINCSEPMVYSSHQAFFERFHPYGLKQTALATCYAMAENVFAVSQAGIDAPVAIDWISKKNYFLDGIANPVNPSEDALPMVSAGPPIPNTHVRVLNSENKELPERVIGEIALHSDCMLKEYYNRPDATQKAFYQDWYLTGDLGYMADGELYITGRKKDLIIVGGKNIYPQDLEYLASDVEGVHAGRVAAFGVFDDEAGTEEVVIVAELEDPSVDTETQTRIADEIRQRINRGSDIVLRMIKLVERGWLLKTSSGKIARSANRDKYLQSINL
jgi:fatty-acyl-CoA synthase